MSRGGGGASKRGRGLLTVRAPARGRPLAEGRSGAHAPCPPAARFIGVGAGGPGAGMVRLLELLVLLRAVRPLPTPTSAPGNGECRRPRLPPSSPHVGSLRTPFALIGRRRSRLSRSHWPALSRAHPAFPVAGFRSAPLAPPRRFFGAVLTRAVPLFGAARSPNRLLPAGVALRRASRLRRWTGRVGLRSEREPRGAHRRRHRYGRACWGGCARARGGDGWAGSPSGRTLIGTRGAGSAGRGGAARGVPDKCGGERRAERCGAPARTARSGGALPFSAIPASLRGAPLCGRCRGGSGWGASGGPFPRFGVSSRLS